MWYRVSSETGESENGSPTLTTPLYPSSTMAEPTPLPDEVGEVSTVSLRRKAVQASLKRDAAIDLRIGLNMLGEEGRKLLAEYITIKRQRLIDNTA